MKNYERPYLEITSYEAEDIITVSGKNGLTVEDPSGIQTEKTFKVIEF